MELMKLYSLLIFGAWFMFSCTTPNQSPPEQTLRVPAAQAPEVKQVSSVVLDLFDSKATIRLGSVNSLRFASMLTTTPLHTRISEMLAAPMGAFTYEGKSYLWHGNGVIHGTGADERLWSGPLLQYLINEMAENGYTDVRGTVIASLARLESVRGELSISPSGLGAYPDGRDALHPIIIQ